LLPQARFIAKRPGKYLPPRRRQVLAGPLGLRHLLSMPLWTQWNLEVAPEQSELATLALHEAGCAGVQVDDVEVVLDESEDASFVPRQTARITGYVDLSVPPRSLDSMRAAIESALRQSGVEVEIEGAPIESADWANQWRENFPPLDIGRFRIVPSWEAKPQEESERIEILLDPGLAFGTGQHPTTRMCLELVGEELARRRASTSTPPASTCTLLDVGCGSGILSIAAAKMGAEVTASDLDEWCAQATTENAERNNVSLEVALAAGATWTKRTFDIVLANLMSEVLISLAPDLRARCAGAASTCIISGISIPRADDVAGAMERAGFQVLERREQDGEVRGELTERWAAFVLRPR
jgi:ribosomal protein L11 methyltransferase